MSKVCEVCGKGKMTGHKVSHSNKKANRTWEVNLQTATLKIDGTEKKVKACTRCIKKSKNN